MSPKPRPPQKTLGNKQGGPAGSKSADPPNPLSKIIKLKPSTTPTTTSSTSPESNPTKADSTKALELAKASGSNSVQHSGNSKAPSEAELVARLSKTPAFSKSHSEKARIAVSTQSADKVTPGKGAKSTTENKSDSGAGKARQIPKVGSRKHEVETPNFHKATPNTNTGSDESLNASLPVLKPSQSSKTSLGDSEDKNKNESTEDGKEETAEIIEIDSENDDNPPSHPT